MASVSVPEKTLEHWSSLYLAYRYKSNAALWWPATGEDIDIDWLPSRPGKAVQIELKTLTMTGPDLQDVKVDLGQLWEYHHRPLSRQPFYAFPQPDWTGELAQEAQQDGVPVTELAFRRSGPAWWFAEWMVLLTTADVARALSPELTKHGSPKRGNRKRLVRYDFSHKKRRPAAAWGATGTMPPQSCIPWRQFWGALQLCGQTDWPQLIRIPRHYLSARPRHTADEMRHLLRNVANAAEFLASDLVTLVPDSDGGFVLEQDDERATVRETDQTADGTEDNRQLVFLDASVMSGN
ncbi:hypothetical protein AB0E63_17520 [Kribbella sp. NPDC026596]|uniref:hypothetical protein n=1 Tax=Kribbella sp. NPDC026596 TaxID=3155122 RepID=UPI0033E938C1